MKPAADFELNPALRLASGRILRTAADAIALLREHEMRPGVDDRDEVLHLLERARSDQERAQAAERFRRWLEDFGVTLPVSMKPGGSAGPAE